MAPAQRPLSTLPQETEAADVTQALLDVVNSLRKEVTELRSRVETNDVTRKITGAPAQGNAGGLGLGDALALIKSTQNDTIQLITGLLATVSKNQSDIQSSFFKGIQFNENQTSKIISKLTAEEAAAGSAGDRLSLEDFAEAVIVKGMELFGADKGGSGELDGMEERNALPQAPAAVQRPASSGNGVFDPKENR